MQFLQPPSGSYREDQNAGINKQILYPDYEERDKIFPDSLHYAQQKGPLCWPGILKATIISLLFMLPLDYLTLAATHSGYFRVALIAIFFVIFNVLLDKINRARTSIYNFKIRAKIVATGSLMILTISCAIWRGQGGHEVLPLLLLLLLIMSVTIILTLLFSCLPVRPFFGPPPYNPYHPEPYDQQNFMK